MTEPLAEKPSMFSDAPHKNKLAYSSGRDVAILLF